MMKFLICILCLLIPLQLTAIDLPLGDIKLPSGFSIEVYALGLDQVRGIDFAPDGVLFTGSKSGSVYAVLKNRQIVVIERGIDWPVGVDYHKGDLYVSSFKGIYVYKNIQNRYRTAQKEVFYTGFPSNRQHGWRYIRFGPDNYLYASIGMPCNVCEKRSPVFGSIVRIHESGSHTEVFAEGIRFSVGFDWDPNSGNLWFTDNGRDGMGDNVPPDELNRVQNKGDFFGFPYMHGSKIREPEFNRKRSAQPMVPPQIDLPAHVAPLGMRFYTKSQFPSYYKGGIFIAEHGSTDRSEPIGYRISFVKVTNNRAVSYEVFARGWLKEVERWGRLADVAVGNDGALYISDDRAHAVYRIFYSGTEGVHRREL